jgi:hypothetical protein
MTLPGQSDSDVRVIGPLFLTEEEAEAVCAYIEAEPRYIPHTVPSWVIEGARSAALVIRRSESPNSERRR